jgi:hypothetical protein
MKVTPQNDKGRRWLPPARLGLIAILASSVGLPLASVPAGATISLQRYPVSSTFGRPGPFVTVSTTVTTGTVTYDVFRPAHYQELGFKSPIVTWGNGTNATPVMYTTLLSHFASYGFTVIASTLVNTGSGREIATWSRPTPIRATSSPGISPSIRWQRLGTPKERPVLCGLRQWTPD